MAQLFWNHSRPTPLWFISFSHYKIYLQLKKVSLWADCVMLNLLLYLYFCPSQCWSLPSSQSSTSISPSVSMSSAWLEGIEWVGLLLCGSFMEIVLDPETWLSLGWSGGTGRATSVSWFLLLGLKRKYVWINKSTLMKPKSGVLYLIITLKQICLEDSPLSLPLRYWFLLFNSFWRPRAKSRGPLFQLSLFQILLRENNNLY